MSPETSMADPRIGELWRSRGGRTRRVTWVSDGSDGTYDYVHYLRPPPAQEAHATTSLRRWSEWVEWEQAIRRGKG